MKTTRAKEPGVTSFTETISTAIQRLPHRTFARREEEGHLPPRGKQVLAPLSYRATTPGVAEEARRSLIRWLRPNSARCGAWLAAGQNEVCRPASVKALLNRNEDRMRGITRRRLLTTAAIVMAKALQPITAAHAEGLELGPPEAFDFQQLKSLARSLAALPHVEPGL